MSPAKKSKASGRSAKKSKPSPKAAKPKKKAKAVSRAKSPPKAKKLTKPTSAVRKAGAVRPKAFRPPYAPGSGDKPWEDKPGGGGGDAFDPKRDNKDERKEPRPWEQDNTRKA